MAQSDSLWLDSDVILDWLANQKPWDAAANEIIERAILGEWSICFSPLTLVNVHYIYRSTSSSNAANPGAKEKPVIRSLWNVSRLSQSDDFLGRRRFEHLKFGTPFKVGPRKNVVINFKCHD